MVRRQFLFLFCTIRYISVFVSCYKRKPCVQRHQFQFPDCYIPDLDLSQLLSSASFLFSHDSGTGYMKQGVRSTFISSYAKTQIGTAYDQLNDGARALDLRPKLLRNGTVVLQHGIVTIPVTLDDLVSDAVRWCTENSNELVLLMHSNLVRLTYIYIYMYIISHLALIRKKLFYFVLTFSLPLFAVVPRRECY